MVTDVNQYLGNPNLKKANVPVEFTKEQIQHLQGYSNELITQMIEPRHIQWGAAGETKKN